MFSVGGPDRLLTALRVFRKRPAIRELGAARKLLRRGSCVKFISKEEEVCKGITDSLQEFRRRFCRERGVEDKGGGRRNLEDQSMYNSIMAGANGKSLSAKQMGRELAQTLKVSHRQINRDRATKKYMVGMDSKRWKRRILAAPKTAIGVGEYMQLYYKIRFCIAV